MTIFSTPFVSSTFSRVTGTLSRTSAIGSITRSQAAIQLLQEQLSTGKRINRPSDDPIGSNRILDFTRQIARNTQFSLNVETLQHRLELTDGALGEITDHANRAEVLLLQEVGDSATAQTRRLAANEVNNLLEQAVSQANSQIEDRFIFGGSRTTVRPFEILAGAVLYNGNRVELQSNIADGVTLGGNLPGDDAFGSLTTEIAGDVAAAPDITVDTKLSTLNGGAGVRPGSIRLTRVSPGPAATPLKIDLSIAENVGDVLDLINAQTAVTGITAAIDPVAGDRLVLSAAAGDSVYVEEVDDGLTANDLGLLSHSVGTADGASTVNTIVDAELAGRLRDDFFNGTLVRIAGGPGPATARVVDYDGATGTFTLDTTYTASLAGAVYETIGPPPNALENGTATAVGTPTTFIDDDLVGLPDNYFNGMVVRFNAGPNVPAGGVRYATVTGFDGTTGTVTIEATPDITAAFDTTTEYEIFRVGLNPALTDDIPLAQLNNGLGIDLTGIRITNAAPGQTFEADVSFAGLTSLRQVIDRINQSNLFVTAEINEGRTGINLVSRLNGARLSVAEIGAGRTLRDLGLDLPLERVKLRDLNNGTGVPVVEGAADFRISLFGPGGVLDAQFHIDLGNASTVQDVLDQIAAQTETGAFAGGRILAEVDPATGDRLVLTDRAADGGTMGISILNGSFAANGLGLTTAAPAAGDVVTGTGLNPLGVQSESIFSAMVTLREALLANDRAKISNSHALLIEGRSRVLDARAEAGGRLTRLALTKTRHEDEETLLEGFRSDLRDVDLADAATRFQLEQVVLQSGLAATARILQTTLLNFL
ncbi:MAG: flagellar hook-associated protein FlgL [Planctomycetes bacterium]|nr:flagellar hook-associated protein FlgL [Planctomycetota bacterium]